MVVFPHCKINLGLHIVAKRPDGFHNIETCFYPVPVRDILEIIPAEKFSFNSTGISIPGEAGGNLCVKAFQMLATDFNVRPVSIYLHKLIPLGAGLGGGSSDGAQTLRVLNQIFDLKLDLPQLNQYAKQLGSDCAFFLHDKPMIGSQKGEVLSDTPLSLGGKFLVLVKPPIHVSTADAYAGVSPKKPQRPIHEVIALPITQWKDYLTNDFESSVFQRHPLIANIKNELYKQGAVYASMSGSGSTVFGIFNSSVDLRAVFPGCYYWSGMLE